MEKLDKKSINQESFHKPESLESEGRFGNDVFLRLTFMRHAEKDVLGKITETGKETAREKGESIVENEEQFDAYKVYHSKLSPLNKKHAMRAEETAKALDEGIKNEGLPQTQFNRRPLRELLSDKILKTSDEFMQKLLRAEEEPGVEIDNKEEASLSYYLDNFFDERPDKDTASMKEVGEKILKVVEHFIEFSGHLKNGSKVHILLISHSGMIEPMLKLLLKKYQAEKGDIQDISLADLGGAMKFLEELKFDILREDKENYTIKLNFRDRHINLGKLNLEHGEQESK